MSDTWHTTQALIGSKLERKKTTIIANELKHGD